jgi:hypothetical protein
VRWSDCLRSLFPGRACQRARAFTRESLFVHLHLKAGCCAVFGLARVSGALMHVCCFAYEYMRTHMHTCWIMLDVMAICRASRTFSANMLATRFLGVTPIRTCMAHIIDVRADFTTTNSWHRGAFLPTDEHSPRSGARIPLSVMSPVYNVCPFVFPYGHRVMHTHTLDLSHTLFNSPPLLHPCVSFPTERDIGVYSVCPGGYITTPHTGTNRRLGGVVGTHRPGFPQGRGHLVSQMLSRLSRSIQFYLI